jgi:hypothetical protein
LESLVIGGVGSCEGSSGIGLSGCEVAVSGMSGLCWRTEAAGCGAIMMEE